MSSRKITVKNMSSESNIDDSSQTYQKLDEIPHILSRPDMYLGENTIKRSEMFLYDPTTDVVSCSKVSYSTGLLKIFDEILINAVDNVQRNVGTTKISLDITDDTITIENNGKSIPIELFEGTDKYLPEVLFTQLRSGSNFNDNEERTTGGRNGYGCKITTIFSTQFLIEINNKGQKYMQIVENNNQSISPPEIEKTRERDMVKISFTPDLQRFGIETIDESMKQIMYKRLHDITYLNLDLVINGKQLPKHNWDSFIHTYDLFELAFAHEYKCESNPNLIWRFAFGISERPKIISFVNYIATYDGGTHVKHISDQIINAVFAQFEKKMNVTKAQIKSKMSFVVSAIIINPTFSSQAKEKLTLTPSKFGSSCEVPEKLIKLFLKHTDMKSLLSVKYNKEMSKNKKKKRITNIEKLVEANYAGSNQSDKCTLFICEGLSAKTMVDTGMCILGHDYYGCFPLKGKILNTRDATDKQYEANAVLNDLKSILGIQDGIIYETLDGLRYGKVVCVKDADADGASIMGLVINFFDSKFGSLLKIPGFFSEFISPMIQIIPKKLNNITKVQTDNDDRRNKFRKQQTVDNYTITVGSITTTVANGKIPFYNEVEYKRFVEEAAKDSNFGQFSVKFIKGLATNEDDDIKHFFNHYQDNCIPITFDEHYVEHVNLAFNKKLSNARKDWIATITPDTHLPRKAGQSINCTDFINNDMVLFARDDCIRSLPSVIDGLKPSQRKIIYTLFTMANTKAKTQMKVFQLGGLVAKQSNYHHGDASMNGTIIKMAQDFPGSNNIPLLQRSGQFGSRQENGDDAGQPRYISACLAEITRYIYPVDDDVVLVSREEDNQLVEPIYYVPIIPVVLLNGITGIGTGWSTDIPAYNPYDIIKYVRKLLNYESNNVQIRPYYRGFKGKLDSSNTHVLFEGLFKNNRLELDITEIPIGHKISDLQKILNERSEDVEKERTRGGKKYKELIPAIINNYVNRNTDDANSVNFHIQLRQPITDQEVLDIFNLTDSIKLSNLVGFNADDMIQRYNNIYAIIDEWYQCRAEYYDKRIKHQIAEMERKVLMLSNKARFIRENIEEIISIRNVPKAKVEGILIERHYDKVDDKYDYLLEMPMYWLTKEKYEQLLKDVEQLQQQLEALKQTTIEIEWTKDLDRLESFMIKNNVCIDANQ